MGRPPVWLGPGGLRQGRVRRFDPASNLFQFEQKRNLSQA
jgi:hypothetical protein